MPLNEFCIPLHSQDCTQDTPWLRLSVALNAEDSKALSEYVKALIAHRDRMWVGLLEANQPQGRIDVTPLNPLIELD